MSPISYDDAYANTNPEAAPEARDAAAKAIMAGVAANDIYWNHVDPLTALKAKVAGHGAVTTERGESASLPSADAEATAIESGETDTAGDGSEDGQVPPAVDPSPQNPNAAIAALRKQLTDAGINPEA